jgi:hypothetical protein
MRGIIVRHISPKNAQNMRRLLAGAGYIDLGVV